MSEERKPIKKNALNEYTIKLVGPEQEGTWKTPILGVSVVGNKPKIDVFTNNDADGDNGRITAPMNAQTFMALANTIEDVVNNKVDKMVFINKSGPPGKQTDVSQTVVGRDTDRRVFISVIAKDKPRVKFIFGPGNWNNVANGDGTMDDVLRSEIYARAWATLFKHLVPNVLDSQYTAPEPKNKQFQKRGTGGNAAYSPDNVSVQELDDILN